MKKICKNCKYYKAPKTRLGKIEDSGSCRCKKFVYNNNMDDIYPLNDKLEYYDYESYQAGFYVGQNFGCIHFK